MVCGRGEKPSQGRQATLRAGSRPAGPGRAAGAGLRRLQAGPGSAGGGPSAGGWRGEVSRGARGRCVAGLRWRQGPDGGRAPPPPPAWPLAVEVARPGRPRLLKGSGTGFDPECLLLSKRVQKNSISLGVFIACLCGFGVVLWWFVVFFFMKGKKTSSMDGDFVCLEKAGRRK